MQNRTFHQTPKDEKMPVIDGNNGSKTPNQMKNLQHIRNIYLKKDQPANPLFVKFQTFKKINFGS